MRNPEVSARELEILRKISEKTEVDLDLTSADHESMRVGLISVLSRIKSWSKYDFHAIEVPVLSVVRMFKKYYLVDLIPRKFKEALKHLHISYLDPDYAN